MKNTIKRELREKAKNHKTTMGVLSVTNATNGKQYIQGSVHLEALVNKMKFLLDGGLFADTSLQKDWKELGSEAFTFEFVIVIPEQANPYVNYRQEISKAEKVFISEATTELYRP
ncbi:GIY-YIG nuclease family protein [Chryseobacterium indologenes]|uniref:GIY-YIG nuclease family protein n=1 Tax=Chryseobacterium indologenes TaxID=253 RepID=A0AAD1DWZ9_CHRID|nr:MULTISPECIES: GIY-YIG nuclease family protein [Chryseobacterium]ASE63980.1 LuxR family transcriptional regulator [Chryseobacterium indologenes]AYZ37104.1 GIY-YIG nuclease family protein [Chryseobacterium indologenes]AZB19769.1 GIY-YIG nuclease family protein [Chryseobacterium indologenes]MBF6645949.1 GIY-YIG nuclease family protein [Chryseobacterium indologenes]MBU3048472.1 GIY-YIG nuclease family protein [Chryseobacterium indologenes]